MMSLLLSLMVAVGGADAVRRVAETTTRAVQPRQVAAPVIFETANLRLEIGADGRLKSLTAQPADVEYAWTAEPMPIAAVYRGGEMAVGSQEVYGEFEAPVYRGGQCFPASAVSRAGDVLTIRFDQAGVTATYRVTARAHYLAFTLLSLQGEPIDRIDLLILRVRRLPFLGPWIDVAWDAQFGLCLCAGNIKTNVALDPQADYVDMRALATREVAPEGTTAVLFGCPNPRERFLDTMEVVERDFQMPPGARNRRAPSQRYSYLWCSPTPGDVDRYIAVDDWTKFIRFDQDTDIQDEAARRIAEIVNATGPYDLVYFDGAEDVHDPFWYHVANAQYRVYRLLDPAPPVCEAAMSGHFSWHIMSRGNAYDVDGRHIKSFCHEISCRTAPVRANDFTRIDFGWIFQLYRDMGPDVLEYVLSRGAAWDCPFSLRLTLDEVAAHPRADDCFDVIRTWEDARSAGRLSEAQRLTLRTLDPNEYRYVKVWHAVFLPQWVDAWSKGTFTDQEHHLFLNEQGQYELAPIREIPGVAGGRVKAFLFQRPAQPDDSYVVLWAKEGELSLKLPVSPERLTVMRPFGVQLPLAEQGDAAVVVVGSRRYLRLAGIGTEQAIRILAAAQ
jgi:hypothetical protein